jgi:hypothetical protein
MRNAKELCSAWALPDKFQHSLKTLSYATVTEGASDYLHHVILSVFNDISILCYKYSYREMTRTGIQLCTGLAAWRRQQFTSRHIPTTIAETQKPEPIVSGFQRFADVVLAFVWWRYGMYWWARRKQNCFIFPSTFVRRFRSRVDLNQDRTHTDHWLVGRSRNWKYSRGLFDTDRNGFLYGN